MAQFDEARLAEAAKLFKTSSRVVALTGAGISVASGIPDFRSPGGLWSRFDPMEYATMDAFIHEPDKVWQMFMAVSKIVREAHPNPAHYSLASLEEAGRLSAIITQNIDGLHQLAGSKKVVEMHGTGREMACPECGYHQSTLETGLPPDPILCPRLSTVPGSHRVHRYLKPNVILFGEELRRDTMFEFIHLQNTMDLLLVIGTSADVYPAAALPMAIKSLGGKIVEVNTSPTRITSRFSDCFLEGRAEEVLPELERLILSQR